MTLRLWVAIDGEPGTCCELPPTAVRHVQVRRLQPGDSLLLFDGRGNQWLARLRSMGRARAEVELLRREPPLPELSLRVHLAVGMPANDRMDDLIEKATELGVASIQPLVTRRSVLRLDGERAARRREHWQAIAGAACEQCGRATVPEVHPVAGLEQVVAATAEAAAGTAALTWLLSTQPQALHVGSTALKPALDRAPTLHVLSGPEGGFDPSEEAFALARGFAAVSLGPRTLRADTAPLALLAWLSLQA